MGDVTVDREQFAEDAAWLLDKTSGTLLADLGPAGAAGMRAAAAILREVGKRGFHPEVQADLDARHG